MISLNLAKPGEEGVIEKVGGSAEVKAHLQNLGFVEGTPIKVISTLDGNVIVGVKDARIAISSEMAKKIMI